MENLDQKNTYGDIKLDETVVNYFRKFTENNENFDPDNFLVGDREFIVAEGYTVAAFKQQLVDKARPTDIMANFKYMNEAILLMACNTDAIEKDNFVIDNLFYGYTQPVIASGVVIMKWLASKRGTIYFGDEFEMPDILQYKYNEIGGMDDYMSMINEKLPVIPAVRLMEEIDSESLGHALHNNILMGSVGTRMLRAVNNMVLRDGLDIDSINKIAGLCVFFEKGPGGIDNCGMRKTSLIRIFKSINKICNEILLMYGHPKYNRFLLKTNQIYGFSELAGQIINLFDWTIHNCASKGLVAEGEMNDDETKKNPVLSYPGCTFEEFVSDMEAKASALMNKDIESVCPELLQENSELVGQVNAKQTALREKYGNKSRLWRMMNKNLKDQGVMPDDNAGDDDDDDPEEDGKYNQPGKKSKHQPKTDYERPKPSDDRKDKRDEGPGTDGGKSAGTTMKKSQNPNVSSVGMKESEGKKSTLTSGKTVNKEESKTEEEEEGTKGQKLITAARPKPYPIVVKPFNTELIRFLSTLKTNSPALGGGKCKIENQGDLDFLLTASKSFKADILKKVDFRLASGEFPSKITDYNN